MIRAFDAFSLPLLRWFDPEDAHRMAIQGLRLLPPVKSRADDHKLAVRAFGLPASEILFVSSNAWDVAGAGAYGFMTCWCNRTNMPADELDVTPDYEVDRLDAILERIGV